MKKKKVSVKNLVILLGLLIVAVAAVLPHFAWVLERAHAGAGLATLVQVSVAENNYFLEHHSFTEIGENSIPASRRICRGNLRPFLRFPAPGFFRWKKVRTALISVWNWRKT